MHIVFYHVASTQFWHSRLSILATTHMHELIESRTKRTALELDSPRRELWLNSPERATTKPVLSVTFQKSFILVLLRSA